MIPCTKNHKKIFWHNYMKAEGLNISENPWIIPWPKNLGRNLCVKVYHSVSLPLLCFWTKKQVLPWKRKNHDFKRLTLLEGYDLDNSFSLVFRVSTYFDLGARFFFNAVPTILWSYLARPLHQCFGGRLLKAAELDCCSDCIHSIREINSERYDGKNLKKKII